MDPMDKEYAATIAKWREEERKELEKISSSVRTNEYCVLVEWDNGLRAWMRREDLAPLEGE